MSAQISSQALTVRFEAMTEHHLDAVTVMEQQAHPHPWQRRHFVDCLASAYEAQLLMADGTLLGYFVAMKGVEEVHLLNITVSPDCQRLGWARVMLDALALWSRGQGAQWLWLEARVSNTRAIRVYTAHGFRTVGVRRQYYPSAQGQREDAVVMSLKLNASTALEGSP
ncbi:ribosomal protein S18-alanine N-acetyltransferase [Rhodoferax sp.]|uniref:ribosomal protein S18-alanine N-acetyltransferase n=1 Tax=Rhodoferax sp. TaxID=50421 RepID=UPI0025DA9CEA|nr:ribosomal protein S18-alanine N-acetyltransferase [Rhodoferax sp.]